MQKTYWWRVAVLFIGAIIFGYSYVASFGSDLGLCKMEGEIEECLVNYNSYVDSLGFLSMSILVVSLFLFFLSDKFFIKWLRFALIWFFLAFVFVVMAPVYTGGWMSFGPTKESVSIWMSSLFVIVSLAMFIREWLTAKK